jgi:hypothetical protein
VDRTWIGGDDRNRLGLLCWAATVRRRLGSHAGGKEKSNNLTKRKQLITYQEEEEDRRRRVGKSGGVSIRGGWDLGRVSSFSRSRRNRRLVVSYRKESGGRGSGVGEGEGDRSRKAVRVGWAWASAAWSIPRAAVRRPVRGGDGYASHKVIIFFRSKPALIYYGSIEFWSIQKSTRDSASIHV